MTTNRSKTTNPILGAQVAPYAAVALSSAVVSMIAWSQLGQAGLVFSLYAMLVGWAIVALSHMIGSLMVNALPVHRSLLMMMIRAFGAAAALVMALTVETGLEPRSIALIVTPLYLSLLAGEVAAALTEIKPDPIDKSELQPRERVSRWPQARTRSRPTCCSSTCRMRPYFHLPRAFAEEGQNGHIYIPQPLATPVEGSDHGHGHGPSYEPLVEMTTGVPVIDKSLLPMDLVLTKFMVIEVLVLVISLVLFGWLARQIKAGGAAKGRLANLLEVFCVFIRDEVARPSIGEKDADDYLPFLWTIFFFVLGCNLFGMIPWMGSPTGCLAVTAVLALLTFITVIGVGVSKYGVDGFLKTQVPHMDLPGPIAFILVPMIFVIELFGLLVKHFVLAVRLLANMMAGHIVLAVLMGFIGASYGMFIWWGVAPASVLGATAMSLLELFVAFLQAYIFVFLSALFIGAVVHPH